MAKKKQESLIDSLNEVFVAQKLAENEFNTDEINTSLEKLDFKSFDSKRELLDYQCRALKNAFRVLRAFFNEFKGDKKAFYRFYQTHYTFANCDFIKPNDFLKTHFEIENNRLGFESLINRLGFYMATGSGKTIVIIKLVELLSVSMQLGLIPKKNIMFFSANENLIKQFAKEIEKYNQGKDYFKQIDFKNLKSVKSKDFYHAQDNSFKEMKQIALFYYRADLMNDESKVDILDYKDYLDNGNNYVILDEAHKGSKAESKKQAIFSLLSLKGFLFNFSATFIEDSDLITSVYNLSVSEWVKLGYGKESILLEKNTLKAFKEARDLNDKQKEIAILKGLLLLSMQKLYRVKDYFHDPLMVVFTHSVNVENSDAEMFFKALVRVIESEDSSVFKRAKEELLDELKSPKFLLSDGKNKNINVFKESLEKIDFKSLKEQIFYESSGRVEVVINPNNKQEIAFKLNTSDKVFCLIKIGDITEWINDKLKGVDIRGDLSFKEESYFSQIDKSSINILVGSRSFDTGWDSTRPNVILFLKIGMDSEAKKFIKQSFGRGVRIESLKNQRQRLEYLGLDEDIKKRLQLNATILETLFVIPTNIESVKAILEVKQECSKDEKWCEIALEKTPIEHALFVPSYQKEKTNAFDFSQSSSFKMSETNYKDLKEIIHSMSETHFILKHDFYRRKDYLLLKKMIQKRHFKIETTWHYKDLNYLISSLKAKLHPYKKVPKNEFSSINEEIVHFKKIKIRADKKEKLIEKIQEIKEYTPLDKNELTQKISKGEIDIDDIDKYRQNKEFKLDSVELLKLKEHYYNPLIKAKECDWLKAVVKVESECDFLTELQGAIKTLEENYDFWAFSKIDEHLDNLFIPYAENGTQRCYYPDFIFWLQKNDTQIIVFIDPKGSKQSDYELKVDGYEELFKDGDKVKIFNPKNNKNLKIKVLLRLYQNKVSDIGKGYKDYWIKKEGLKEFFKKVF
ncbi:DEAD/DEAH box helicase family protein [Helicobacter cetorum]|uniref:DEAD/DEAH box helicase family protein n=1 Tax=Helicobacter cetorum TaxID=138563 RepID=UPI000CF04DEA|nr:DEAD/DEAH box helicase family protein [Helicobacter cetorum]